MYLSLDLLSSFLRIVWVRAAPALVCLCPLSLIQSIKRSQDSGIGTLVAGPCWCALLFSVLYWWGCFRCLWYEAPISGLLTISEHRLVYWGRSARHRTEQSLQGRTLDKGRDVRLRTDRSLKDWTLDRGRGRSSQERTLNGGRSTRRRA